jgi:hypothetical protein
VNESPVDKSSDWYKRGHEIGKEVGALIGGLAQEGQRSTVIVGAARLDIALERLLKGIMAHHPGESDNLFHPDRPLGTFSAKIALCYRLGLIDRDVERSLQLIRKIRNDFAHSITTANLSESTYRSRLLELCRETQKDGNYAMLETLFAHVISHRELLSFAVSLAVVICAIDIESCRSEPVTIPRCARFHMTPKS